MAVGSMLKQVPETEKTEFDYESFFSSHWRKKPLLVRGGARDFLGRSWSMADFDAAAAKARAAGHPVHEHAGQVTFIERVSDFDDALLRQAKNLQQVFGVPAVWFDSVRTYDTSGIGAHFDHSDNFVLQQQGVKHWRLAPPELIEPKARAARMLNMPEVGSHRIPEGEHIDLVLEPGDLLYLPLLWLHEGISEASSLSVSAVCPAVSVHSAVMSVAGSGLRAQGMGGVPVPALHAYLSPDERREVAEEIRAQTTMFLNQCAAQDFIELVVKAQLRVLNGVEKSK
jgi:50S ribosomal protein L16 3-hydroxylase